MAAPKTAMILAAGLGLRMRPLTDDIPKALVEIAGQPLIGHVLDRLADATVERIVVNVHYRPDPLLDYLKGHRLSAIIDISDEREQILETGGGVKKALRHFGNNPFFVANCDSFFRPDDPNPFGVLARAWQERTAEALLLLAGKGRAHGYHGAGDFFRDETGALTRRGGTLQAPFVFTGLQILEPGLFEGAQKDVFSLNDIYDKALSRNTLSGIEYPAPWYHIGTPGALREAGGQG